MFKAELTSRVKEKSFYNHDCKPCSTISHWFVHKHAGIV
jgi:hypothetical protein